MFLHRRLLFLRFGAFADAVTLRKTICFSTFIEVDYDKVRFVQTRTLFLGDYRIVIAWYYKKRKISMDEGVLYGFLDWFKDFFGHMLGGLLEIFKGLFYGIIHIFDFPYYFKLWSQNGASMGFSTGYCPYSFLAFACALGGGDFLIVLGVRKYIRFRRTLIGNEDLLEEIADLHRDVVRLNNEKEKIMQIKVQQAGITYDELKTVIDGNEEEVKEKKNNASDTVAASVSRFARLSAVDNKYLIDYVPPEYNDQMSLSQICDDLRNFACYNSKLYYDPKTIRLMLAGFAATKLIILQGISGTGKTSLPYIMGKYF